MATTFDDMTGVSVDRFYTFDDPMFHDRLDDAYATGVIVRDGPGVTLDQSASGVVDDGFDTIVVRDHFVRTAVPAGWGNPSLALPGQSWTAGGSEISTDGNYGLISPSAVNVLYHSQINGYSDVNFDFMVLIRPTVFFTGAKGSLYLLARYTDFNNCLRFRVDFNTDQIIGYGIDYMLAGVATNINPGGLVQFFYQMPNQWYYVRVQGNGPTIRLKIWQAGSAQPDEWATTKTDPQWSTTPGTIGAGFVLNTGNTNALNVPVVQFDLFWAGLQKVLDNSGVTVKHSFDDGMPQGATNTDLTGASEATAGLLAPIGEKTSLYYSPFRTDKPFGGFQDRDVSTVAIASPSVTDDGIKTVRMFTGQMTDIPLDGEQATLQAVSRTRLKMSTPVQPPVVHGTYEGCELTWMIGYALWKSGVQNVPPTLPGIRYYAPMNGSTHTYYPDDNVGPFSISQVYRFPPGVSQFTRPQFIDGPYPGTAALDGAIGKTKTLLWGSQGTNMRLGAGDDLLSQTQAKGRIEYWVKGVSYDVAGSPDPGALYLSWVELKNPGSTRYVRLFVPQDTRIPGVNINDGTTGITFPTNAPVPIDNQWHFVACSWDFPGNSVRITMDGFTTNYGLSGLSSSALPLVDDISQQDVTGYWPLAELRITGGLLAPHSKSQWARDVSWSRDAIMRRSVLTVDGIAEPAPREAFELITSVARCELAKTGFDANDNFMYLSMPYWAEATNQAPLETLSTAINLGLDFKPYRDVTKIYNTVQITFTAKVVQEIFVAVYQASNLIVIPVGYSTLVVPLSAPATEIRNVPAGLSVLSGTALAAAPPSDANAINYITANTATDGTGTYATPANLQVAILAWDSGEATLGFTNGTGALLYVANNVNIPSLGLAAKVLVGNPQTITASSLTGVVPLRGVRLLPIDQAEWLQNVHDASAIASELSSRLGFPRTLIRTSALGDPRRAPGQVVNVTDPDASQVSGVYRITSVENQQTGEDLRQTLTLEQALPIGQWDTAVWDNAIWGP